MQTIYDTATHFHIVPLSDRSVLVSFGNIIDSAINEKVIALHKKLQQSAFEGFIESAPISGWFCIYIGFLYEDMASIYPKKFQVLYHRVYYPFYRHFFMGWSTG